MKKIAILIFFFTFLINNANSIETTIYVNHISTSKNQNKPKINKNTPKRVEYGCKRPKWGNITENVKLKYANVKGIIVDGYNNDDLLEIEGCIFSTRHFVLFNTSKEEPVIEVKNCNNKNCCYVLKGAWEVFNGEENVVIEDPKELQIDHVLPFSYIRLNMKDCKRTNDYYNYLGNLKPELAAVNFKKSNKICETENECDIQKSICQSMAEEFEDKNLCEEINKIQFENED